MNKLKALFLFFIACLIALYSPEAFADSPSAADSASAVGPLPAKIALDLNSAPVRKTISFRVEGLQAEQPVKLLWETVDGSYELDGIYKFIGTNYQPNVVELLKGESNAQGVWQGEWNVPEDFGGDHTLSVWQNGKEMAQTDFFLEPTFHISPASGPVGTEITITAEGIGWRNLESNWELTYDNKMTGLISAVSTKGKAVAKIRAAGPVGMHMLTIWHGYLGIPYINYEQAPNSYLPVPHFTFEVTKDKPVMANYVEQVPESAAGGGVKMPELMHKQGVEIHLSKAKGTVGEQVTLSGTGLPAGQKATFDWTTMVGNRVTSAGFSEKSAPLGEANVDMVGKFSSTFPIPDDLGGVPHRIDVKVGDEVVGQAYLSIVPSIVKMTPTEGPAGTEIEIEIKGVGWTEYHNAYQLTYDNSYLGYMCGFNSQGTIKFTVFASGESGYHILDFYPGIYRGQMKTPDIYVAPQLTYEKDHPGTAIPAIRLGFTISK